MTSSSDIHLPHGLFRRRPRGRDLRRGRLQARLDRACVLGVGGFRADDREADLKDSTEYHLDRARALILEKITGGPVPNEVIRGRLKYKGYTRREANVVLWRMEDEGVIVKEGGAYRMAVPRAAGLETT